MEAGWEDGGAVGGEGLGVFEGEPGGDAVEGVGAEDDGGDDGFLAAAGEEGCAAFGGAAVEDGEGSVGDAAFGEDADDLAGFEEVEGAAECGDGDSGAVEGDGAEGAEGGGGEGVGEELLAGEPVDSAGGLAGDEEGLEVGDVGDGEDVAARMVEMRAVEYDLAEALKSDELAGEAGQVVKHGRHGCFDNRTCPDLNHTSSG